MPKHTEADDVREIAQKLIPLHHKPLEKARIEYVFSDKVPKAGKVEIWGTMRKVSGLAAYFAADKFERAQGEYQDFFCMTITKPIWDELDDACKEALVDHELMHATTVEKDGEVKLKIVPHDLEEFTDIVKRHGFWRESIKMFMEARREAQQRESA
jgi:hypothetical protein